MASPAAVEFECSFEHSQFDLLVASHSVRLRREVAQRLVPERWRVLEADSGSVMLELLRKHDSRRCVLLLDPTMPSLDSGGFRAIIGRKFPDAHHLLMNSQTGQLLLGAEASPVSTKLVRAMNVRPAPRSTRVGQFSTPTISYRRDTHRSKLRGMIGSAVSMQQLSHAARRVAALKTTVLITGECGTGKDLLAQEIHLISQRRNKPFVVVNCLDISEASLEADLFGYVKGAFTGAVKPRIGRIHAAHGGTLFLDQIGAMPLSNQSKILRFLDQGEVQRLGGKANLKVDVRVIAASDVDLKDQVTKQRLREDLYYRLAVFPLHVPPLRERMSDLEELANSFTAQFLPGGFVSFKALKILSQHSWRGNVRELRRVIHCATTLAAADREIKPEHIFL